MNMTLYIIGNGFDIHHNIKSSYKEYKKWLETNAPDVYDRIVTIYGHSDIEWWNQFEQSLADVTNEYTESLSKMTFSEKRSRLENLYGNTDAIDYYELDGRDINDEEFLNEAIIKYEVVTLINDIKHTFHEWVDSLKIGGDFKKVSFDNTEHDLFLNFNYTLTLEDANGAYKINPENVTHIHGKLGEYEYVIGHNLDFNGLADKDIENGYYPNNPTDEKENLIYSGRIHILECIKDLKKDTDVQIDLHKKFFNSLDEINKVVFLGFSYSQIDFPYIEYIFKILKQEVSVVASYHSDEDGTNLKEFFNKLGIKNYTKMAF